MVRSIEINNQCDLPVDQQRLSQVVELILADAGFAEAEVSIAIVDDSAIWALNRAHLQHDYPTDVLSFRLDDAQRSQRLEGEVIVSADTAAREAPGYEWTAADELLLYVIHGTLHLVGYDDADSAQRQEMRHLEADYLSRINQQLGERHRQSSRRD